MVSEAEVCRRNTSSTPSPASHWVMKFAACAVISVKPLRGVSTRKVALAMTSGVAALIADKRPGMA